MLAQDVGPPRLLRRARLGVATCFFLNAVFYAGLVPRLPEVKAQLGLSSTALGAALAAVPLGALLAGLSSADHGSSIRIGARCLADSGLVARDLPADVVAVGNPARIVRTLDGSGR